MSDEQDDDNSRNNKKVFKFGYYAHQLKKALTDPIYWTETAKTLSITLIAILIVLLGILIVYGIYLLTVDLVLETSGEQDNESFANIRNSLFILAALMGIPFFLWRTWIAQQQSNIAEHQAETARDRAYTELFTKAIEQLGAEKPAKKVIMGEDQDPTTIDDYVPNIEVRIGAIFALERIMKDSEKDAASVVDTLAAYVRENCGKPTLVCEIPEEEDFESTHEWVSAIKDYVGDVWSPEEGSLVSRARALRDQPQVNRADINTALTVIGRRPYWLKDPEKFKSQTSEMPDLQNVNFQGWDLRKFDLSWCNLSGANMQGANLYDGQMQGVDMRRAQMQGANMSDAKMKDADIAYAKLQGANMSRAKMQGADMQNAEMLGADMTSADMQGTKMLYAEMQGADMSHAKMQGANMSSAQMQGADMSHAKMQGADMRVTELQGAKMSGANMQGADMSLAQMKDVDISYAKMKYADMSGAKMQGANMSHAQMHGANMRSAQMQKADMFSAEIQGADMARVKIEKVPITWARKTAASVVGVDFTKAHFGFDKLQEQLPEMFGHKKHTTLPKDMAIPEHWSEADMRTDEGRAQYAREWEAFKKKMGVE